MNRRAFLMGATSLVAAAAVVAPVAPALSTSVLNELTGAGCYAVIPGTGYLRIIIEAAGAGGGGGAIPAQHLAAWK